MNRTLAKAAIDRAFSGLRNNNDLAHDNSVMNFEESLLSFNCIGESIRIVREIEAYRSKSP
jgi:hypothetical protein